MSVSVILLAYNEAENLDIILPQIIKELKTITDDYEIIVVDSQKSEDNTKEIADKFEVKYIVQNGNDYASAFKTGLEYATKKYILNLDADGSHSPEVIPALYRKIQEGYDMVIGSRYVEGGITHDYKTSIMMSKLLNFVMRICLGVKAKDISTSFRIYDAELLKSITIERKNFDIWQEVILKMKFIKKDFKIGEVPIVFEKRIKGTSKRKLFRYIAGYFVSVFKFTFYRIRNLITNK